MLAMHTTSSAAEAGLYLQVTEWVWIAGALVGFGWNGGARRSSLSCLVSARNCKTPSIETENQRSPPTTASVEFLRRHDWLDEFAG